MEYETSARKHPKVKSHRVAHTVVVCKGFSPIWPRKEGEGTENQF